MKELRRDSFNVAGTATFANGDGLCFLHRSDDGSLQLEGFRVNRAVGNRLYPFKMPRGLRPGMALYRNQDQAFEKELGGESAVRTIPVTLVFAPADDGFSLSMTVQEGLTATATVAFAHDEAKSHSMTTSCGSLRNWVGQPIRLTTWRSPAAPTGISSQAVCSRISAGRLSRLSMRQ